MLRRPVTRLVRAVAAALLSLCLSPGHALAQLAACARIADPAVRLACYDELARAKPEAPAVTAPPPAEPQRAKAAAPRASKASRMEADWELLPESKRGIFNLVAHRPLYGLLHWTSASNDQPSSPTRPFAGTPQIELDRAEGKIQLSFKTKVIEGAFGTPGDLWFGYTQLSYWQVGNQRYSAPFRETNYEPQATYIYPLSYSLGDLRLRFVGLTLNHQSNGRGGALSRSWNRLVGEAAAEYGAWSFHVRPWTRIFASSGARNDNPDIEDFAGRGELVVTRRAGGHVLTLTGRHSLRSGERSHGSAQIDYAFPLAGALNAHLQIFSGYGQNLIDYNHRQTTLGLGVSFFD